MEELKVLIKKGIIYEDEFILAYTKIIKEEELLKCFGDKKEQAEKLFNKLIRDSTRHKASLENIIDNL